MVATPPGGVAQRRGANGRPRPSAHTRRASAREGDARRGRRAGRRRLVGGAWSPRRPRVCSYAYGEGPGHCPRGVGEGGGGLRSTRETRLGAEKTHDANRVRVDAPHRPRGGGGRAGGRNACTVTRCESRPPSASPRLNGPGQPRPRVWAKAMPPPRAARHVGGLVQTGDVIDGAANISRSRDAPMRRCRLSGSVCCRAAAGRRLAFDDPS